MTCFVLFKDDFGRSEALTFDAKRPIYQTDRVSFLERDAPRHSPWPTRLFKPDSWIASLPRLRPLLMVRNTSFSMNDERVSIARLISTIKLVRYGYLSYNDRLYGTEMCQILNPGIMTLDMIS